MKSHHYGWPRWTRPSTNASCQLEKPESSQVKTWGSASTLGVELGPPRCLSSNRRECPARKNVRNVADTGAPERRRCCQRNAPPGVGGERNLAPRHGFEPRFTAPKAAVLPLDDRGKSVLQEEVLLQCSLALRAAATDLLSSLVEANLGRCRARASNPSCGTYVSHVGSTPTSFRQIRLLSRPITISS